MSEKGLQILARKELLPNIKGKSLGSCIDCLAGKQHRVAFHRNFNPPEENAFLIWFIVMYAL